MVGTRPRRPAGRRRAAIAGFVSGRGSPLGESHVRGRSASRPGPWSPPSFDPWDQPSRTECLAMRLVHRGRGDGMLRPGRRGGGWSAGTVATRSLWPYAARSSLLRYLMGHRSHGRMLEGVELAGIQVARELVLKLTDRLALFGADDTAALLLIADVSGDERVGLSISDREVIISVLDKPPEGLEMLRAVLLAEHVGRRLDGLTG
jgi:hypothetical protein